MRVLGREARQARRTSIPNSNVTGSPVMPPTCARLKVYGTYKKNKSSCSGSVGSGSVSLVVLRWHPVRCSWSFVAVASWRSAVSGGVRVSVLSGGRLFGLSASACGGVARSCCRCSFAVCSSVRLVVPSGHCPRLAAAGFSPGSVRANANPWLNAHQSPPA
jgi:hypothetical protein